MRELGVRAWSVKKRKFLNIDTLYCSNGKVCAVVDDGVVYDVEDVILEQYTGLKDKNGKEIREGDILRFKGGLKSIVKFCEMEDSDCTYFYLGWASVQDGNEPMSLCEEAGFCEVIGNIHENPELLEGKL